MDDKFVEIQNQLINLDSTAVIDEALGESSEALKETLRRNREFDQGIAIGISQEEVLAGMRRVMDEARP